MERNLFIALSECYSPVYFLFSRYEEGVNFIARHSHELLVVETDEGSSDPPLRADFDDRADLAVQRTRHRRAADEQAMHRFISLNFDKFRSFPTKCYFYRIVTNHNRKCDLKM
jgi:hypothetical protein